MPIRFLHVAIVCSLIYLLVVGLNGHVDKTLTLILAIVGLVCVVLDIAVGYAPLGRRAAGPPA